MSLLGLPGTPTHPPTSSPNAPQEGTIAFAEDFAARAMEDWALKPRIDDELSEEEKKVLLEQAKKRRDEHRASKCMSFTFSRAARCGARAARACNALDILPVHALNTYPVETSS